MSESRRRSKQFKLKSKNTGKIFKQMKKSFYRKETSKLHQEIKKIEEDEGRDLSNSDISIGEKDNSFKSSISDVDDSSSNKGKEKDSTIKTNTEGQKVLDIKPITSKNNRPSIDSIKKLNIDKKIIKEKVTQHLIDELGLESAEFLTDEKKIEEFIVLRAIKDTNLPKFHDTDTIIFESI